MILTPFGRRSTDRLANSASSPDTAIGPPTAFIDQGSEFEGKLSFKDTARIDGRFRGEISSENTLEVGETGQIDADVKAQNVMISGEVTGKITAARMVVLFKTARVKGTITTPSLIVEEGANFNGEIAMGGTPKASVKPAEAGKAAPLKAVEGKNVGAAS